tara:strand:+ start:555 stop:1172 length:618 start_codon:yes stop_codon:yes gene_type:complete
MAFLTTFVSSAVTIHGTSTDRADEVYRNNLGTLLRPPFNDRTIRSDVGVSEDAMKKEKNKNKKTMIEKLEDEVNEVEKKEAVAVDPVMCFSQSDHPLELVPRSIILPQRELGERYADGWNQASVDVVISGIGWVAITCAEEIELVVHAPKGKIVLYLASIYLSIYMYRYTYEYLYVYRFHPLSLPRRVSQYSGKDLASILSNMKY